MGEDGYVRGLVLLFLCVLLGRQARELGGREGGREREGRVWVVFLRVKKLFVENPHHLQ